MSIPCYLLLSSLGFVRLRYFRYTGAIIFGLPAFTSATAATSSFSFSTSTAYWYSVGLVLRSSVDKKLPPPPLGSLSDVSASRLINFLRSQGVSLPALSS